LPLGFPLGLHLLQILLGLAVDAEDALFVEREVGDLVGRFAIDASGGEQGMGLGVIRIEVPGFFKVANAEDAVLHFADAPHAPEFIDHKLDELVLLVVGRLPGIDLLLQVGMIEMDVVAGQ